MRYLLLFLLAAPAYADCTIVDTLQTLRPGAPWVMQNNDPSTLVWMSTQTIPSKTELQTAIATCQSNLAARTILKAQARLDVKNTTLTPLQRLQALLILLDLDQ